MAAAGDSTLPVVNSEAIATELTAANSEAAAALERFTAKQRKKEVLEEIKLLFEAIPSSCEHHPEVVHCWKMMVAFYHQIFDTGAESDDGREKRMLTVSGIMIITMETIAFDALDISNNLPPDTPEHNFWREVMHRVYTLSGDIRPAFPKIEIHLSIFKKEGVPQHVVEAISYAETQKDFTLKLTDNCKIGLAATERSASARLSYLEDVWKLLQFHSRHFKRFYVVRGDQDLCEIVLLELKNLRGRLEAYEG